MRGRLTPAAVRSLHSATVGVVGLGQIGLAVATLFRAAGAQVGYSDPAPRDPAAAAALGLGRLDLGALLAGSDVVTLHVPLVPATRGLIGGAELRRMRPGAILVNASRGGVVDEAALAAALEDGHLGVAVVDVYAQEPPEAQSAADRLGGCSRPGAVHAAHRGRGLRGGPPPVHRGVGERPAGPGRGAASGQPDQPSLNLLSLDPCAPHRVWSDRV